MSKYLAVIETTSTGFAAHFPDIPGCIATGQTREEVVHRLTEGVALHVAGQREDGQGIPEATSTAEWIDVPD